MVSDIRISDKAKLEGLVSSLWELGNVSQFGRDALLQAAKEFSAEPRLEYTFRIRRTDAQDEEAFNKRVSMDIIAQTEAEALDKARKVSDFSHTLWRFEIVWIKEIDRW